MGVLARMGRLLAWVIGLLALAVIVLVLIYAGTVLGSSLNRHYWAEMDWSGDGRVSLAEAMQGADVGRRAVTQDGVACTEFFAFKDGLPIRTDCPRRARQEER